MAAAAVSGIKNITQENNNIVIETNDGQKLTINIPVPEDGKDGLDGVSIVNIKIENNHLKCELSNGNIIDAGEIIANSQKDFEYTSKADIDELFKDDTGNIPVSPAYGLSSKEDIDNLFSSDEEVI